MNSEGQARSPAASPRPRPRRLYWLGGGAAVGIAIALLDIAHYFPFVSTPGAFGPASVLSSVLMWGAEGAIAGAVVAAGEGRDAGQSTDPRLAAKLVLGVAVSVVLCHAFAIYVLRDQFGIRQFRDYLGQPVVLVGGILYHGWLLAFFGALVVAAYASLRRRARMFAALHEARMRRESSQNRLARASLVTVRKIVDPDDLLSRLALLERLYESDPDVADRALAELIAFLRRVLADIRIAVPT